MYCTVHAPQLCISRLNGLRRCEGAFQYFHRFLTFSTLPYNSCYFLYWLHAWTDNMSSTDSSDVRYRVQPGVISAAYFILFDLVLLTFLDVVLARVVCSLYYRRINKGGTLDVKSVDVPGLTTFLVGRRTAFPNLLALFVKIVVLACILIIDINIDANVVESKTALQRSSTFFFDPSDAQWEAPVDFNVTRRWERTKSCHISDRLSGNITYYALAFNLSSDPVQLGPDNNSEWWDVNDSTIVCLKDGQVEPSDVRISATISGCSQHFGHTSCTNGTKLEKNYDLFALLSRFEQEEDAENFVSWPWGDHSITYQYWHMDASFAALLFPEYTQPNLTCVRSSFGPLSLSEDSYGCIFVEYKDGLTLVDKWRYNDADKLMWRDYPGPLFEGDINIGLHASLELLQGFFRNENWETISGMIVADSTHYRQNSDQLSQIRGTHVVTRVSPYAIALAVFLVLLAIISRIVVAFTIGKDQRPQINSIDGLSSIAREVTEPTGCSYIAGREAKIGLCHRDGYRVHFGPLRARDQSLRLDSSRELQLPS